MAVTREGDWMETIDRLVTRVVREAVREEVRAVFKGVQATQTVEPTWTNNAGVTMQLCGMPTRYLRNVREFAVRMAEFSGRGSGLLRAIDAELESRGEE